LAGTFLTVLRAGNYYHDMPAGLPYTKVGVQTLPKVSYSTIGKRKVFISAPEGRLNIFVKGYLKKNLRKYITYKNLEIDK